MWAAVRCWPLVLAAEALTLAGDTPSTVDEEVLLTKKQMRAMHTRLDLNADGQVSMKEILEYAQAMTKTLVVKEAEEILQDMDKSKDGAVSLDEHLRDLTIDPEGPKVEATEKVTRHESAKFKAADENGDGVLHKDELASLIFPQTHDTVMDIEAKEVMRQKDLNRDGKLSLAEFAGADDVLSDEHWAEQFKKADADGDGFLNMEELKRWEMGHTETEHAMKTLMASADKDGDGHLSPRELEEARGLILNGTQDEIAAMHHILRWVEHHEL